MRIYRGSHSAQSTPIPTGWPPKPLNTTGCATNALRGCRPCAKPPQCSPLLRKNGLDRERMATIIGCQETKTTAWLPSRVGQPCLAGQTLHKVVQHQFKSRIGCLRSTRGRLRRRKHRWTRPSGRATLVRGRFLGTGCCLGRRRALAPSARCGAFRWWISP